MSDVALHGFGALAIVAGALLWTRSSVPRIGRLVLVCGAVYYLGDLRTSRSPVLFAVGFCLAYLWTAVIPHVVLALPDGRLTGRTVRALVACCYLGAVGTQVGRFVAERPRPPWWWNMTPGPNTAWAKASSVVYVVLAVSCMLVVVRRWTSATRVRRRNAAAMWAAGAVTGAAGIATATVSALGLSIEIRVGILIAALGVNLLVIPIVLLARRIHLDVAQGRAARTVLDVERTHPAHLQRALAEAVGDPTLTLAYAVDKETSAAGAGRPGRAVTPVVRRGALVALLEHDEALTAQRRVADAAIGVAGLAIENAQLYALQQAQLEELRRSRMRLSTAAFEERHRIQRDLHDGAQQQLYGVLLLLDVARRDPAPSTVDRAHALLRDAIGALGDLTQGIYPADLAEHGLAGAVERIAEAAPVPVRVEVPPDRWPRHVELTAYFLVTEAVANAYKHGAVSRVDVAVGELSGRLLVQVADDGRGGAVARPGSGLSGLYDRVAAVGGTLTVVSPIGRGTTVTAVLPLEDPCE